MPHHSIVSNIHFLSILLLKRLEETYLHSDHLGSSSFITDANGITTQHLQYLPYGELFVEQRSTANYFTPYKFSAKEKDEETGYSYFGARYYLSDISGWPTVDEKTDENPNISPYAYCAWNPIRLIDPDGRDWYENELTGSVYFNNKMGKNDAGKGAMTGEGWKHMGENGMFTKNSSSSSFAEFQLVGENGGNVKFNDLNNGKVDANLMLEGGGKAESFMKNQGYDKLPTQYIEYSNTRTDKYPFVSNKSISITTGDKIQINEKYGYFREGSVGVPYNIRSMGGNTNPLIGSERVDRKGVNYFDNRLVKIANSINNIYSPISGNHDYTNNKIYNSWGEYPKSNVLINNFKKLIK